MEKKKAVRSLKVYTAAVPITIGHLMMAQIEDEEIPAPEKYIKTRKGVDFSPSSMVLSAVDAKLRLEMGAVKMLSDMVEPGSVFVISMCRSIRSVSCVMRREY